MKKTGERYQLAFILAILVHVVLLGCLFFKFRPPEPGFANPQLSIIQATAINIHKPSEPIAKLKKTPVLQQTKLEKPLQEKKKQQQQTEQKALAQQKLKQEQVRQATIAAQQLAEKQHQAEMAQQQQEKKKQQQRIEQQQKTQAEKRKQAKLAKEAADQAIKRQQALAASEAQQKAAADLQQRLAAEEQQVAATAAQNARIQQEVDKYKAIIIQAISQHWIVPDTTKEGLSCKVRVRLAPGGMVLNVTLITSSGDPALDRSAIAAVNKASPLPVPTEATVFEPFREIDLIVQPNG